MLRSGLNRELGFDKADRDENLRRVAEMAKLLNDQGLIVIAVFISPDRETRLQVKEIIGTERYKEIFIDTSVEFCQTRDTEGLYEKAALGKLRNFPGVDSPYETGTADIILNDLDHVDIKDLI
jgi:adenylylsulfate kinase-like enzyme